MITETISNDDNVIILQKIFAQKNSDFKQKVENLILYML